jgi:predicted nucleic acid-binding protein
MGLVERLQGQLVGLDTAPLIYFIERNETYLPLVRPFFQAVERGDIRIVTSALTLTEVLSHPIQRGNDDLVDRYTEILLSSTGLTTVAVSTDIAIEAASMRAAHRLKTPDAIQLATARQSGATAFLTNDNHFDGVAGLEIVTLNGLLLSA